MSKLPYEDGLGDPTGLGTQLRIEPAVPEDANRAHDRIASTIGLQQLHQYASDLRRCAKEKQNIFRMDSHGGAVHSWKSVRNSPKMMTSSMQGDPHEVEQRGALAIGCRDTAGVGVELEERRVTNGPE